MNRDEARQALDALNRAIATAALLIRAESETLERFFIEQRHMENVGVILDPTLFKCSERRAVEALLTPVYGAARDFLAAYDRQVARAGEALKHARGKAG